MVEGVVDSDDGFGAEDLVVAVFAVDQLELIELHVLGGFFELVVFLGHLFLQVLDQFDVFVAGRTCVVEVLQLHESTRNRFFPSLILELLVFLIEKLMDSRKLGLHVLDLLDLLFDQLVELGFGSGFDVVLCDRGLYEPVPGSCASSMPAAPPDGSSSCSRSP